MNKKTMLVVGLAVFAFTANAQTRSSTQQLSDGAEYDLVKENLLNMSQTNVDAQRQAQYQQQQTAYEAQKLANQQAGGQASMDLKMRQAQREAGYPEIPGFVFTGDPAVDGVNYDAAKLALKRSAGNTNQPNTNGN
jgi:multidrug efflux pump subunit AcrA (membrane-fusion protein)